MAEYKFMTYNIPLPYKSQAKNRRSDALTTINVQRNQHYRGASQFKLNYSKSIEEALPKVLHSYTCCKLSYTLHIQPTRGKPTKADPFRGSEPKNIDLINLLAVVDKVNSDVLVSKGVIPDDSIRHIQNVVFSVNPWSTTNYIEVCVIKTQPIKDIRKNNDN